MEFDVAQYNNPEIGKQILVGGYKTNYHDSGSGFPVILIHGSGPGVSAWANWRLVIHKLAENRRVIAPDMLGFGYTDNLKNKTYEKKIWVNHTLGFMDALKIEQVDLVGNSFGGGIALDIAVKFPERVRKLVLMGSTGVSFELTKGLDDVWGYTPSLKAMRNLLDIFSYNRNLVNDELANLRYEASIRLGAQDTYASMFPAPRQKWIEDLASTESDIEKIYHETLIIHGREDEVIPIQTSLKLLELVQHSQLHVFGQCGHWTQIEHTKRFIRLVDQFLNEEIVNRSGNV
ncbi:alpha/beta fold hydrolase [Zhongshania sp. BJYM1]|uniref:alpha/beta fold hydrolase n=1 Tax=Zhongshania aquatica TaxID=2965069 RepID=UPI0022B42413|nr:alpha/beta hydrolase [Marortus sp. BJYM1]